MKLVSTRYIKNILITGAAGFIASSVAINLVTKYPEYNIIVLDKLDYCSSLKNLNEIIDKPNYKFIQGDILSEDLISYILKEEKIDTIMHFAAQTHVDKSFSNSLDFTKNNVLGTHNLLECCKKYGQLSCFIHVSTDEVYGEVMENKEAISETSLTLEPSNPYSTSKVAAEFYAKIYYKLYNIPIIITRGNNVYGPKQYPEKIIPKFIKMLLNDEKLTIHGNGMNKRSYLYVDDVANAFETILHKGKIGEIYNIGTDFELTNLDIANYLISYIIHNNDILENIIKKNIDKKNIENIDKKNIENIDIKNIENIDKKNIENIDEKNIENIDENNLYNKYIVFVKDRPFNDFRYSITNHKLNELGWEQKTNFKDGIKKTIDWYVNVYIKMNNILDYWS